MFCQVSGMDLCWRQQMHERYHTARAAAIIQFHAKECCRNDKISNWGILKLPSHIPNLPAGFGRLNFLVRRCRWALGWAADTRRRAATQAAFRAHAVSQYNERFCTRPLQNPAAPGLAVQMPCNGDTPWPAS